MIRRTWVVLVGLSVVTAHACSDAAHSAAFSEAVVKQYTSLAGERGDYAGPVYIVGKAIVVNTGEFISIPHTHFLERSHYIPKDTVSTAQREIDAAIRASTPSEVATVVLLQWAKVAVRETMGGTVYRLHCEAIVVDKDAGRIVGRKTFPGAEAAWYDPGTHGPSPQPDIVRWINGLPRRSVGATRGDSPQAEPQAPKMDAAVRGATREYLDSASQVSFQYPAAWAEMGPAEARQVMGAAASEYLKVVIYDPEDRTQNVNVQVMPVMAEGLTEDSYSELARKLDSELPGTFPDFRKISSRVGRLQDMASLEYVFEATRPDGVRVRLKQLRTGKAGREVAASFTARADLYEATDQTCFRIIIDTLKVK